MSALIEILARALVLDPKDLAGKHVLIRTKRRLTVDEVHMLHKAFDQFPAAAVVVLPPEADAAVIPHPEMVMQLEAVLKRLKAQGAKT